MINLTSDPQVALYVWGTAIFSRPPWPHHAKKNAYSIYNIASPMSEDSMVRVWWSTQTSRRSSSKRGACKCHYILLQKWIRVGHAPMDPLIYINSKDLICLWVSRTKVMYTQKCGMRSFPCWSSDVWNNSFLAGVRTFLQLLSFWRHIGAAGKLSMNSRYFFHIINIQIVFSAWSGPGPVLVENHEQVFEEHEHLLDLAP